LIGYAPDRQTDGVVEAREFTDWASRPYHSKFLQHLDRQIEAPIPLNDHELMKRAAIRMMTFREIRETLRVKQQWATELLGRRTDDE
jgi:hypothetical protein